MNVDNVCETQRNAGIVSSVLSALHILTLALHPQKILLS